MSKRLMFMLVLMLVISMAGCSRQRSGVKRVRLSEPYVAVCSLRTSYEPDKTMTEMTGYEECRMEPFSTFPRSFPHKTGKGVVYWGADTLVALFEPCEDPDHPGNLLISFEIIHDGEVFQTPEISWNQKDELDVAYGEDWLVKLTSYKEEWQ